MSQLPLSEAQREFIAAAERRGATEPSRAVAPAELSPLSHRELQALVDSGLVREAAEWKYYLFRGRGDSASAVAPVPVGRPKAPAGSRLVKALLFWLFIIIIPIILFRFARQ